jgi:hypothetical protein
MQVFVVDVHKRFAIPTIGLVFLAIYLIEVPHTIPNGRTKEQTS